MSKKLSPVETKSIRKYFEQNLKEAHRLVEDTKSKASHKNVHQLRVSLRRLRMILEVIESNNPAIHALSERKDLSKLFKKLGKHRDLDVAIQNASQLNLKTKELEHSRDKIHLKTIKKLDHKKTERIFDFLNLVLASVVDEDLDPTVFKIQLAEDLGQDFSGKEGYHQFRKVLKRIRYLLEACAISITPFKVFQDELGRLNDLKNLKDIFSSDRHVEEAYSRQVKRVEKIIEPARKLALQKLATVTN